MAHPSSYSPPVGQSTPRNWDEKMDLLSSSQTSVHIYRGLADNSQSTIIIIYSVHVNLQSRIRFITFQRRLSVIVRENRAGPKDRGRPFTFIFSQYKSYPKRLTTMIFAEVGVRFSSRYHHIMILTSQAV